MNKVMFIPADPKSPYYGLTRKEYTLEYNGQNKAPLVLDAWENKGHNAMCVWYDGGTDPFLSSLNTGQIYLRGHGNPGDPCLAMAKSGGENIHFTTIVQRLITSGLKREFSGVIKCWNCHSAEPSQFYEPFAQLFANELYAHGYKYCTFFGYVHAIDSFPKQGSQGLGYYARQADGITEIGKAKSFRTQIHPRPRPKSFAQKLASKYFK
jgi:hypothetical protein